MQQFSLGSALMWLLKLSELLHCWRLLRVCAAAVHEGRVHFVRVLRALGVGLEMINTVFERPYQSYLIRSELGQTYFSIQENLSEFYRN